jgi:dehydrogenase/reductase SDR family protein 1
MANRSLDGHVAIVAGASRGIGMGVAIELGAAGAFVYALGRTLEPGSGAAAGSLVETVDLVESLGGNAVPIQCDCTDESALEAVIEKVRAGPGRLDVLVNSVFAAGPFSHSIGRRFWETSTDAWSAVVDLGARSAYAASVLAAPLLITTARDSHRPTLIVNVSGRGAVAYRYNVVYGVGKAATERLTRDMAIDLAAYNVAVVSIWPNGHASEPVETPRYNGRAVAALAADRSIMDKSGAHYWSAELGAEYDFTDELGHRHEVGELEDESSTPDGARAARDRRAQRRLENQTRPQPSEA